MGAEVEALKLTRLLRSSRRSPVMRAPWLSFLFSQHESWLSPFPSPALPFTTLFPQSQCPLPSPCPSGVWKEYGKRNKSPPSHSKIPSLDQAAGVVSCVREECECPLINAAGKLRQEKILCSKRLAEKQGGSQDSFSLTPPCLILSET